MFNFTTTILAAGMLGLAMAEGENAVAHHLTESVHHEARHYAPEHHGEGHHDNYYYAHHGYYAPTHHVYRPHGGFYGHARTYYGHGGYAGYWNDNEAKDNYWPYRYRYGYGPHRYYRYDRFLDHGYARSPYWQQQQDNSESKDSENWAGWNHDRAGYEGHHPFQRSIEPYHYRPYYSHNDAAKEATDNAEENYYYRWAPSHYVARAYHYRPTHYATLSHTYPAHFRSLYPGSHYTPYFYGQQQQQNDLYRHHGTEGDWDLVSHVADVPEAHHAPYPWSDPDAHVGHHYLTCDAPGSAATDFQAGIFRAMNAKYDTEEFLSLIHI